MWTTFVEQPYDATTRAREPSFVENSGGTAVDGRRPERCLRARLNRAAPDGIKAQA